MEWEVAEVWNIEAEEEQEDGVEDDEMAGEEEVAWETGEAEVGSGEGLNEY